MGSDGEQKTAAPAAATALSFAKFDLLRKTLITTEKLLVLASYHRNEKEIPHFQRAINAY